MASPGAYYDRPNRGPSPWLPATILGIILLIATTPYRSAPDVAMAAYHPAAARKSASFIPPGLIWIPVIFFLLFQFFGGRYGSYYNRPYDRPYGAYGDTVYPPAGGAGLYNDVNYIRYNGGPYADRGVMSSFMDYGGHWLLILLGIWLFSLVGYGSAPAASTRLGFPFSLFAPQPQVVMPIL